MPLGRVVTALDILRSTLVVFILFNEFSDDKSDCSMLEYQHSIREIVRLRLKSENESLIFGIRK